MKKRIVATCIAAGLLAASFSANAAAPQSRTPATVSASQNSLGPFGVYSDYAAYKLAFERARAIGRPSVLNDNAKKVRRRAINFAMANASTRQDLQQVANRFGLVIYDPNLNDVSIASDSSDIAPIPRPTKSYDSNTGEAGFFATIQWQNFSALSKDANYTTGPVGGADQAGLSFSKMTDPGSALASVSMDVYDVNGRYMRTYWNRESAAVSPTGGYAVVFSGQDNYLGNSSTSGFYDFAKMSISVWVTSAFSDRGSVTAVYAHTWNSTEFAGVSWNGTGSSGWNFGIGLTFNYSTSANRWGAEGLGTSY